MGWWWSSDPQTPVLKPSDPTPDPQPTAAEPPASPREVADKPTLSRDELADVELKSFLSTLSSDSDNHAANETRSKTIRALAGISSSRSTPATEPDQPTIDDAPTDVASISPDALLPTTMSCRQAFDQAFYCQSLGGQFNSIYRFGAMRSCSELWSQWRFCMRTKSVYDDETKGNMIRDHYRERLMKYKVGPSSEDVWEMRTEPVESAFNKDPDALDEE